MSRAVIRLSRCRECGGKGWNGRRAFGSIGGWEHEQCRCCAGSGTDVPRLTERIIRTAFGEDYYRLRLAQRFVGNTDQRTFVLGLTGAIVDGVREQLGVHIPLLGGTKLLEAVS